jgi:hypothetical protein
MLVLRTSRNTRFALRAMLVLRTSRNTRFALRAMLVLRTSRNTRFALRAMLVLRTSRNSPSAQGNARASHLAQFAFGSGQCSCFAHRAIRASRLGQCSCFAPRAIRLRLRAMLVLRTSRNSPSAQGNARASHIAQYALRA